MGIDGGVGRVEVAGWRLSRCHALSLKGGEAGEAAQSDFNERSSADDHMKCPQVFTGISILQTIRKIKFVSYNTNSLLSE